MVLSICWAYLLDVPIDDGKKILHQPSHIGLSIGDGINFQNYFIFLNVFLNDTCSNENDILVYVQQIFQKLNLYQHRVD